MLFPWRQANSLAFSGRINIKPLSYTQISSYRSCPLCYKLQYIDGLKQKEKWYFSFGTSLHACVEYFFKVNTPPPPTLEELLKFYDKNWLSVGYASAEDEKRHKDFGRQILTNFWKIHQPDFRIPIALERGFSLDVDGIKVRGYMDRVDKLESGGLAIVDYKSNKELFTAEHLANDLQLTIYQMAAEQTWGLPVERLTLYHLRTNTPCFCTPRGAAQIESTRRLITETAEKIAKGEFPATENDFCPCDFAEHCPFYRHKYHVEAAPQFPTQARLPGIAASDAVERYASLQVMIKDLQSQLDETRREIVEFCQKEGICRVFGSEHEMTYKIVERAGYAEDEVRAVLEPLGIWESVVGLDPARLKQLLADGALAADIKKKIEGLKKITSSYPLVWLKKSGSAEEEE
ncbi:MAG TPA: PD-(D/E)XK nuclease family protein [Dehalococcoidales bacterium]|nr:PD-(D/E)XK nuclease family protein [Dehalococcoidales bacterium]